MANIKVTLDYPISDGTKLKFRTPCESTEVDGLVVRAPMQDGIGTGVKTFNFVDANGNELSGLGNVFASDVIIAVILDVTKGRAYIKNADTNTYIESIKETIARMDEERKTIYAEAGKVVEECKTATIKADEVAKTFNLSAEEVRSGGFVEALRELNAGENFTFWVGDKEHYDFAVAYKMLPPNTFCIITDETTEEGFLVEMEEVKRIANAATEVSNTATEVSNNAKEKTDKFIEEMQGLYFNGATRDCGWFANSPSRQNPLECEKFIGVMPYGSVVVFDNVQKDHDGLTVTLTASVGFLNHMVEIYYAPGDGAYRFNDFGTGFSHIIGNKGAEG